MNESPTMTYNFELNDEINALDIKNHVLDILKERFVGGSKTTIEFFDDRWNFACPMCGDSTTDSTKKRGNIYLNDYHFHCFNCGEHRSLLSFLKRFDRDFRSGSVLSFVQKTKNEHGDLGFTNNSSERVSDILGQDITEYAIPKDVFFDRMGLKEIQNSKRGMAYLLGREQKNFENFGWDERRSTLFIFNLDYTKQRILGYQIRRFSENGPKYLTYEMSAMYKELGIGYDEELMKRYDPLSTIFGCLSIDLSSPITIFEGPLDSFLLSNSIALCSLNKKPPFMTMHTRFLFDYDKSGIEKSLQLLKEGNAVFMWYKFFSENIGFEHFMDKTKVDFSDIVIYAKKINKKIDFNQYFTNNYLNAIWIGKTNKKKKF